MVAIEKILFDDSTPCSDLPVATKIQSKPERRTIYRRCPKANENIHLDPVGYIEDITPVRVGFQFEKPDFSSRLYRTFLEFPAPESGKEYASSNLPIWTIEPSAGGQILNATTRVPVAIWCAIALARSAPVAAS
jgi:hypothetical protein